jgi:hypothetical protein
VAHAGADFSQERRLWNSRGYQTRVTYEDVETSYPSALLEGPQNWTSYHEGDRVHRDGYGLLNLDATLRWCDKSLAKVARLERPAGVPRTGGADTGARARARPLLDRAAVGLWPVAGGGARVAADAGVVGTNGRREEAAGGGWLMAVWVVEWGDESPAEVDGVYEREPDAQARARELNERDGGNGGNRWTAQPWELRQRYMRGVEKPAR